MDLRADGRERQEAVQNTPLVAGLTVGLAADQAEEEEAILEFQGEMPKNSPQRTSECGPRAQGKPEPETICIG
jgi:hypothetical protein